ncbi:MAG TPA: sulfurtransferase TusA family protein [Nitrospinota bacterium]|jgi:sulfite reductase (ferredoxin)|nr:sulfurtransferase TusA family protein [Nitrospinota bacterium]
MKSFYNLPEDLKKDIEAYKSEIVSFLKGGMHPTQFRGKRVPRGIYEQRTNDTFMMRIRIPAGGITPVQMEKASELSNKYGNGILHITTRQDVQLHWVKLEDTPEVMFELLKVGLTTKGGGGNTVRNITACYEAGICKCELFNVSPYAIALTEHLIKDPKSYTLPRKFKISFSGCSDDCSNATVNDIGFIAAERSLNGKTEYGFRVYVAGGMGAKSKVAEKLEDFISLNDVGITAEAIKRVFDKHGNRKNKHKARLRFLFEKIGHDEFVKLYRDELKELKKEGGVKLDVREISVPSEALTPSAAVTDNSGEDDTYNRWLLQNVFPQKQNDFYYVKVFLELGDISAEQLKKLAGVADNFREGTIRSTHDQNLAFRWIHKSELKILYDKLKEIGLNKPGAKTIENITCCAGASTCRLGICLSRGLASALSKELRSNGEKVQSINNVNIKISGCPNACGQDPIGQIGFLGAARRVGEKMMPNYIITLGGRVEEGKTTLGENIGMAPSKDIPSIISGFLKDYTSNGRNPDFYEYIEKKGKSVLKKLIDEKKSIPSYKENKDYYIDWSADEEFSLEGRGEGECGAGVFDMMEVGLKEAKRAMNRAEETLNNGDNPAKELYQAINHSSHALLVTRGVEAKNDIEAFEFFEDLFINTKLVDKKFRKLMYMATEYKNGDLKDEALKKNYANIKELTHAVADLYNSMDDSLQFKTEKVEQEEEKITKTGVKADSLLLDLKGVKCPFNYVKAKLKLETMETGAFLELFLDDGEPIKNVPNSLKNDGQEILEKEKTDTGHYRLLIKKKV